MTKARSSPNVICLSGPDAVGKTTQASLLIGYLKSLGVPCVYAWMRYNHFVSILVLVIAHILGFTQEVKVSGMRVSYHQFHKSKLLSLAYSLTSFIDTLLGIFIKVRMPRFFGRSVVCDRFIHDTLVDLMIDTQQMDLHERFLGKLFLRLAPRDAQIIILLASKETQKHRRNDVSVDSTLPLRLTLYKMLASRFRITILYTDRSVSSITQRILTLVSRNALGIRPNVD